MGTGQSRCPGLDGRGCEYGGRCDGGRPGSDPVCIECRNLYDQRKHISRQAEKKLKEARLRKERARVHEEQARLLEERKKTRLKEAEQAYLQSLVNSGTFTSTAGLRERRRTRLEKAKGEYLQALVYSGAFTSTAGARQFIGNQFHGRNMKF